MNGIFLLSLFLSLIKTYDFIWLTLNVEPKTGTEIELVYLGRWYHKAGERKQRAWDRKGERQCRVCYWECWCSHWVVNSIRTSERNTDCLLKLFICRRGTWEISPQRPPSTDWGRSLSVLIPPNFQDSLIQRIRAPRTFKKYWDREEKRRHVHSWGRTWSAYPQTPTEILGEGLKKRTKKYIVKYMVTHPLLYFTSISIH